ncbi:MAG: hypothetical protein FJ087_08760 [Deltaproteobacteria bacterium]|nr:hypothetical protein [Deltaproteobacteria bacterium]
MTRRAGIVLAAICAVACGAAEPPSTFDVVVLTGTPYERGVQHGRLFASKIRSLYTRLLETSLLPYLNREQPDIASVLPEYRKPEYGDGRFSYELLVRSGRSLAGSIPEPYLDEMRGIADGSGVPYDRILLLNTFMDSLFNMRAITFFIRQMQAPRLVSVDFGDLAGDGADNDGDGETDEAGEGRADPYEPSPHATMVEVPPAARVTFLLRDLPAVSDPTKPDRPPPEGVDPASVRLQWDLTVISASSGDPRLAVRTVATPDGDRTEVTFAPDGGFAEGAVVSLLLQAGDLSAVSDPPPTHARWMRDERVVFTTRGHGKAARDVPNRGERDGRTQPPSVAAAVRGAETPDGKPRLAHNFAMLDANTSHKHSVVFVHRPAEGRPFAVVGWTGVVWGFSGMNADGLAYAVNLSDSLDNGMVEQILDHLLSLGDAKLLARGTPVGIMGREALARATRADEAAEALRGMESSFGWNFVLADADGGMVAVERDTDILDSPDGGYCAWGPAPGEDKLLLASHAVERTEDISVDVLGLIEIRPQRYWTSFYFRSLRAAAVLAERVAAARGTLDAPALQAILSVPDLVDVRDSMNAVVFEPADRRLHVAAGQVPATDGPFVQIDLGALAAGAAP